MDKPNCPISGAPMVRDIRPMTLAYRGHSVTFDMPGWYCDESGESTHSGEDMKISDKHLNLLKARAEKRLTPDAIKRIRKKLGLTQKQTGLIVGGGPNAFQKYESGAVLISHAATSALLLLDKDPSGLVLLQAHLEEA